MASRHRNRLPLRLGILCWALPRALHAGPPLITDDPGTPGPNRWELNVATTLEYGPSDYLLESPLLDVNYGVGERVQLKVECPWAWTAPVGHAPSGSLGNPVFGVKWRFLDQESNGIDLSVYPQFDFNPTIKREAAIFDRETEFLFPFEIAWSAGTWQVYGDVGFDWAIYESDIVWAGIAGQAEVADGFDVMAEVHVEVPTDASGAGVAANVGFTYDFNDTFTLLASGGTAAWTGGPDLLAYLGLQSRF